MYRMGDIDVRGGRGPVESGDVKTGAGGLLPVAPLLSCSALDIEICLL